MPSADGVLHTRDFSDGLLGRVRVPERPRELGRWVGAMILFEALGFGLAFVLGNLVHGIWMRTSGASVEDGMPLMLTIALSLLVGAAEGASLATGQWLVMRRRFVALRWSAWAGATALGGALAWALGMGLGGRLFSAPPPVWLIATVMVASGLIFGGILGTAQWLALRAHAERAGRWIPANAIGWTVGLLATYAAAGWIDESTPLALSVVIGLVAGATMAIVPALLTGISLARLHPR